MDSQEIRTLKILEEVDNGHLPSQRDLAKTLNVSLGLVNSFLKRLASKGYFKITHIPKNRVRYILTPKGAAEKTRLTYQYLQYSFTFYKSARQRLKIIFSEMSATGIRNIILYGVGDLAEIAYLSLQETTIRLSAIIDDQCVGKTFFGIEVKGLKEIDRYPYDRILITEMERKREAMRKLEIAGIDTSVIRMIE